MNNGKPIDGGHHENIETALWRRGGSPPSSRMSDLFAPVETGATVLDPVLSLNTLRRWKWTIACVFGALSFVSLSAIWLCMAPTYSSTAVVRVASSIPRVLYKTEDNGTVPLFSAYINTQVSVIQSPEVLSRVFNRDDVKQTEWYNGMASSSPDVSRMVDKLARQLVVGLRRGTELIDIMIETAVPADAAVIVNAVAEEYKKYWDEMQTESERQRVRTLREQLAAVNAKIEELFNDKFKLAEKMGTTLHDEVRLQMLADLRAKKMSLELLKQDLTNRQSISASSDRSAKPTESDEAAFDDIRLAALPAVVRTDATWLRHQEEYVQARKRLELARSQFGLAHPKMQAAIADVDEARRLLRLTEQRLGMEPYTSHSPLLAEKRTAELEKSIDDLQHQLAQADGRVQELSRLDEIYNDQKQMRRDLMDRTNAIETEANAPARVSLQSAGLVRNQPSTDRRALMSACAMLCSVLIAFGVGYVRGRIDPKIHDFGDIGADMSREVPFLGQLPRAHNILSRGDSLMNQAVNENVRIIRTMLLQRLGGRGSVVITSPEASSGKTTVAILLARSLATMGKKVLLVDVDMLHPAISHRYDDETSPGLRGVLTGKCTDEEAIVESGLLGLDVMPIGHRNGANNADMLALESFPEAIRRWKSKYDVVLLDSPPVLAMADARITASHSDGAIMVLRSSGSKREDAAEAFASISGAGARLLGTLLVGVPRGSAYHPYYYHHRKLEAAELLA